MTDLPSDSPLHVVFGTGQVGRALVARLTDLGITVRAISQQRPGLKRRVDAPRREPHRDRSIATGMDGRVRLPT
jgi:uncharacterized protein YbjT (DUF2867 family)